MKKNSILLLFIITIISLILYGCEKDISNNEQILIELKDQLKDKEDRIDELINDLEESKEIVNSLESQIVDNEGVIEGPVAGNSLLGEAITVMTLLKAQDMTTLGLHVSPIRGVRFTPYPYIDVVNDLVFAKEDIPTLLEDSSQYNWGIQDGIGEPIVDTFAGYYDVYVYDEDYVSPHLIGNNTVISSGNTINNIKDAYPNGSFVEFHFTGFDPQYEGMDWSSLTLVFEDDNGTWYLVGVIHGEWTI